MTKYDGMTYFMILSSNETGVISDPAPSSLLSAIVQQASQVLHTRCSAVFLRSGQRHANHLSPSCQEVGTTLLPYQEVRGIYSAADVGHAVYARTGGGK